ncbi:MAG: hypothetical protein Q7R98_02250 [Candidatus Jorgensenbacteria bacterium]|nr:hypothetical protein [Candidatus Jorgensenbacteria bacterium]
MALEVKKREGETLAAFLYRFNKRIKNSGLIKEARKRQTRKRSPNKRVRRASAIYRLNKEAEISRTKKYG